MIIELLLDPAAWLSLLTLTLLEIILGIDNLIFVAIAASELPSRQRARARSFGLGLALLIRIGLLASIAWIVTLTQPVVTFWEFALSWRDIILLAGGFFLLGKAIIEIHKAVEGEEHSRSDSKVRATFLSVLIQIALLDMVFSFDSILTAVGLSDHLPVMVLAICLSMLVMLVASGPIAAFVEKHLSVKILALAFLVMISMVLISDGLHVHVPKGYVYSSIGFGIFVQGLALWGQHRRQQRRAKASRAS